MNTEEQAANVSDAVVDTCAGKQGIDLRVANPGRRCAIRVGSRVVGSRHVDGLEAQSRSDRPAPRRDPILYEKGPGPGVADPVRLTARGADAGERLLPTDHLVAIFALEPVLLVGVVAYADLELLAGGTAAEAQAQDALDPLPVVFAVVVALFQCIAGAVGAAYDGELLGVGQWALEHAREPGTLNALQLVPVALKVVAVGNRGQVDGRAEHPVVAELELPVLGLDPVVLRAGVAAHRIRPEVGVCQAEVGLVAALLHVTELDLDLVEGVGATDRPVPQLPQVVTEVETGLAAAIDLLEAFAAELVGLEHPAPVARTATDRQAAFGGRVAATAQFGAHVERIGHRRRDEVQGAAVGPRPELDLARALAHLDGLHPARGGEVVGGGCCIGCGSDQGPVLHERDAGGTL